MSYSITQKVKKYLILSCSANNAGNLIIYYLGLMLGLYLAGVAGLLIGLSLSKFTALLGLLIGFLMPYLLLRKEGVRQLIIPLVMGVFLSLMISGCFVDFSTDGGAIHGPAIQKFLDGWKPYTDSYSNLSEIKHIKFGSPDWGTFWMSVYPKAAWICGAQIVELTGRFEQAKALNFLAIITAGLTVYRFLSIRFPRRQKWACCGAILLALNPVSVCQAPTFLIDGLLASVLTILLFSLAFYLENPLNKSALFEVSACVIILINLKFTGVVYVVIILVVFLFFFLLKHPPALALKFACFCAILLLFSVFICGKAPYADNLIAGRHPFAPLFGKNPIDIMTAVKPVNLLNHNRFTKFFISNCSFTGSCNPPGSTTLRWPFTYKYIPSSWDELQAGGFGPMFEESILLACIVALMCLINMTIPIGAAGLFLCTAILISGFINPEVWWARYAPQLFLLPGLVFLVAIRTGKRTLGIIGIFGFAILLINLLLIGSISTGSKGLVSYRRYLAYSDLLAYNKKMGMPIEVEFGCDHLLKRRFLDIGIPYLEINTSDPLRRHVLPGTMSCYWQLPK